jgi:hypothetical protein
MADDCAPTPGSFPWPPANGMAMSAFRLSDADIRWDDPAVVSTGPDPGIVIEPTTTAVVEVICVSDVTLEAAATGSLQVINAPLTAGETVEIDGVVLTVVNGSPSFSDEFDGSSSDPAVVAAHLAAAINNGGPGAWGLVSASATGTLITLTAVASSGTAGNDLTLVSTSPRVIPSGPTLTGGTDVTTITIGGITLTAATTRTPGNRDFSVTDSLDSLVLAINDPANGLGFVTAARFGGCVRIYAALEGEAGNGIPVEVTTSSLLLNSPFTIGGSGIPCPPGRSNAGWNILGVNVYRSDTGERGPYFRVNQVPVQTFFYRDRTDIVEVPAEIVPWDGGWIFKGDSPNNKGWRLKTRNNNVVKRLGNAIPADSPFDVEVTVDGEPWPVVQVFGPRGEIDMSTERVWDPSTESFVDPPIPTETSTVVVRYRYQRTPKLVNTLDDRWKVFYRLTTVAEDPFGTSPSGMIETPLGYSPPISPMESERIDAYWKEAVKRNRYILEQGGERVKLFIRRMNGVKCRCVWDDRLREYSQQPRNMCLSCFGTGWVGGYEGPYDIIIGPDNAERRVMQTPNGRRLEHTYEVWIGPSPMVSQRDFIVKQNGERYSIGPVRRDQVRGVTLQQTFQIGYLSTGDIRYRVPMGALERLPWPQTRYTRPQDVPCEPSDPYPLGCDPQASPMATQNESGPDGRESRGRTPIYQNLMYGSGKKF